MKVPTIEKLNSLLNAPLEEWLQNGVPLCAASANSRGQVNSGITRKGRKYFFRKWSNNFSESQFVFGE
jgi:hypothetical protein